MVGSAIPTGCVSARLRLRGRWWHPLEGGERILERSGLRVSNGVMRLGVLLWVAADWRRRRRSILLLVVFAGIAGAVALTAVAGARRSATSLERFADRSPPADVLVDVGALDGEVVRELTQSSMVDVWGAYTVVFAIIDGVESDLAILAPRDDRIGVGVERSRLLRGRLPDSTRADEMAVNESAADIVGVDVGDVISISTMTPEQVRAEEYFPPLGPELRVHVVGVVRGTDDLAPSGADGGAFFATEAWLPTVHGAVDEWTTYLGIGLVSSASAGDFASAVQNLVPPGQEYELVTFEERSKAVRGTISTLATGLAVFAIVAGVATAIAVGQAVSRHVAIVRTDEETLGQIGLTRTGRCVALVLTALPVALGGAAVATLGSWGASSMVPLGLARRTDPDPGRFVDWAALGGGALAVVTVVVSAATLAAAWMTRSRSTTRTEPVPSKLAESVFRAGGGPVLSNGVRLAVDRRAPGLPVRSAVAGVALALAGVFGALTFSSSLGRLSATPERWGYGWDLLLNFTSSDIDSATEGIVADDRLTAVARWDAGLTFVDGSGVQAFGLTSVKGDVGYSLRSGRQPLSPAEVVLGSLIADRLGIDVGEQVTVANSAGTAAATSMLVVGTGIFPDDGEGSFNDAIGFYGDAFAEQAIVPDLFEASQLVVRVAPGIDIQGLGRSLNEEYPGAVSSGDNLPFPPAEVANLTNIRSMPVWLAAFVVLLGVASLLHVLLVTVWRRRSELAVLRSIGLTPRQTAACLIWQALTITGIGLVVGVPLGLVIGNAAWFAVANPIGVATDSAPPLTTIGSAVLVSLGAAVLLAIVPGWRAARARPAESLRVE